MCWKAGLWNSLGRTWSREKWVSSPASVHDLLCNLEHVTAPFEHDRVVGRCTSLVGLLRGFHELSCEGLSRAQSKSPISGSMGRVVLTFQLWLSSTPCVGCRAWTLEESSGTYFHVGTFAGLSLLCVGNDKSVTHRFPQKGGPKKNRLGAGEGGKTQG